MNKVLLGPAKEFHFLLAGLTYTKDMNGIWHPHWNHEPKAHRLAAFAKRALASEHGMAGWTDETEQAILDDYFQTAAGHNADAIALGTTNPSADDAALTGWAQVPDLFAYAKQSYVRNATNWGAASGLAPAITANLTLLTFPTASGGAWGTVTNWVYQAGVVYGTTVGEFWAALTLSKAVDDGDTAEFGIGDMEAKLGDPGDSY